MFISEKRRIYTLLDNGDRSAMSIVNIRVIAYDTRLESHTSVIQVFIISAIDSYTLFHYNMSLIMVSMYISNQCT